MDSLNDVIVMFNYEFILIFCLVFLVGYVAGITGALIALAKCFKGGDLKF